MFSDEFLKTASAICQQTWLLSRSKSKVLFTRKSKADRYSRANQARSKTALVIIPGGYPAIISATKTHIKTRNTTKLENVLSFGTQNTGKYGMDQPRPRFPPWCARRILVIVATKIDGNMLHWPICSEFAQCCCKFLNRFQKLATCCSTANIAKNCSQRGVKLEQFFAQHRIIASWRCKLTSVTPPLQALNMHTCIHTDEAHTIRDFTCLLLERSVEPRFVN